MADEKTYRLVLRPERWERIDAGHYRNIRCLKIEPTAEFGGVFVRAGRMWGWVSDDPRRIVPKIVAKIPIGSVTVELEHVSGPGDDFWVRGARRAERASSTP